VRTVRLYGHLGKRFGRIHQLEVRTPAEAIRALSANFKQFAKVIADGEWRILVGGKAQSLDQIQDPLSADISIVPAIGGAGGFGKIVLGAALIAASFYLPGATYFSAASAFSIDAAAIASGIGTSLLIGGISEVLFAPPKASGLVRPKRPKLPIFLKTSCAGKISAASHSSTWGLISASMKRLSVFWISRCSWVYCMGCLLVRGVFIELSCRG
jgi:predicted phage tail protein